MTTPSSISSCDSESDPSPSQPSSESSFPPFLPPVLPPSPTTCRHSCGCWRFNAPTGQRWEGSPMSRGTHETNIKLHGHCRDGCDFMRSRLGQSRKKKDLSLTSPATVGPLPIHEPSHLADTSVSPHQDAVEETVSTLISSSPEPSTSFASSSLPSLTHHFHPSETRPYYSSSQQSSISSLIAASLSNVPSLSSSSRISTSSNFLPLTLTLSLMPI
jgi:hypothetical protein